MFRYVLVASSALEVLRNRAI